MDETTTLQTITLRKWFDSLDLFRRQRRRVWARCVQLRKLDIPPKFTDPLLTLHQTDAAALSKRSFGKIQRKLERLTKQHPVTIVYPMLQPEEIYPFLRWCLQKRKLIENDADVCFSIAEWRGKLPNYFVGPNYPIREEIEQHHYSICAWSCWQCNSGVQRLSILRETNDIPLWIVKVALPCINARHKKLYPNCTNSIKELMIES